PRHARSAHRGRRGGDHRATVGPRAGRPPEPPPSNRSRSGGGATRTRWTRRPRHRVRRARPRPTASPHRAATPDGTPPGDGRRRTPRPLRRRRAALPPRTAGIPPGLNAWRATSVQARGELAPVIGGTRVGGSHQLEDVDELLAGLVVGLHLFAQRVELFVVVVVHGGSDPGAGSHLAGPFGFGDPDRQPQRFLGIALCDQQLGKGDDHVLVRRFQGERETQTVLVAGGDQLGHLGLLL